jgi:hypothetical protein
MGEGGKIHSTASSMLTEDQIEVLRRYGETDDRLITTL